MRRHGEAVSKRSTERGGWLTAADLWRERCAESADNPFLWFEDQRWSYAEFDTWTDSLAQILSAHGIKRGNRVAFILPNCAQGVRLILAAAKIGCVLVPVMANLTRQEISHVIRSSGPAAIIGTARYTHDMRNWPPAGFRDGVALDGDGSEDALVLLKSGNGRYLSITIRTALLLLPSSCYTSGQTSSLQRRRHPFYLGPGYYRYGVGQAYRPRSGGPDSLRSPAGACRADSDATRRCHLDGCRDGSGPQIQRLAVLGLVNRTRSTHAVLPAAITSILLTASPAPGDADNPLQIIGTDRYSPDFCQRFGVQARTMWAMTETSAMGCMSGTAEIPGDGNHRAAPAADARWRSAPRTGSRLPAQV